MAKAELDAAFITAEQTFSLLEQKYQSIASEFSELQSKCAQLQSSIDQRLSELADVQAQKHQLHLQCLTHPHLGDMPLVIFSVISFLKPHLLFSGRRDREAERRFSETSTSLKLKEEKVRELETRLTSLQEEFSSTKDSAATNDERFMAEISTVHKLVD
ncbi:hypothetical protein SAY87_012391 [Trapa incisa]|uniref:Uncharacterized protein n=1 Tax=Trapa incisa TaxID=236973 RepID=A0AAN7JIV1_9MYRT|nr:hypothetical protein SAY87_012391 [Trapa incisa]